MTVRVFAQQETTTTPTSQEPVGAHAVPPSSDEQTVRVTTCIRGDMPVDQQPRSSCSLAEQHAARVGIDAGRLRRAQVEAKLPSGAGNTPPLMEPAAPASPPWTLPKAATGNTPSLVEPAAPPAGQSGLAVQAGRTHAKVTAKNSTKENASKLAARAGRARCDSDQWRSVDWRTSSRRTGARRRQCGVVVAHASRVAATSTGVSGHRSNRVEPTEGVCCQPRVGRARLQVL